MSATSTNVASLHPRPDESRRQQTVTSKLRSYAASIKRHANNKTQRDALRPVRSLKFFLDGQSILNKNNEQHADLGAALNSALIVAVRTASLQKEYRIILSLLESAVKFSSGESILAPRVFGEAFECLSRTSANASKLWQAWQLAIATNLNKPLGAFELNIMLKALGKRRKIHSALQLFRSSSIEGDAFTATVLLNMLTSSITDDQAVADDGTSGRSPCWQYEEAMQLIREFKPEKLNNHVFCAALKLNERASAVFPRKHEGVRAALALLGSMKTHEISPDVVTCTQLMSFFDKHREWRAAVALLESMVKGRSVDWTLPKPNQYTYSAAISACARCGEYDKALSLLDQMRGCVDPNTWVYNAALSACVSSVQKTRNRRIRMALSLLEKMEHDHSEYGLDTAPDTVSYNTALAVMEDIGSILRDNEGRIICEFSMAEEDIRVTWENLVAELLEEMHFNGIPRDTLTYHNAIKASKLNSPVIFRLLQEATQEALTDTEKPQGSVLTGRAGEGLVFVFNAALSTFAPRGDMELMSRALAMMKEAGVEPNSETITHLVVALGRSRKTRNITALLYALRGSETASGILRKEFGIDLSVVMRGRSKELEKLYTVSITSCLAANDVVSAMEVLSLMKKNGLSPSTETIEEIAFAYANVAVVSASEEAVVRRELRRARKATPESYESISRNNALRALAILNEIDSPSPELMSAVSGSLTVSGQYEAGREIMCRLHTLALEQQLREPRLLTQLSPTAINVLPKLHRSVLKICAAHGNVTAALDFVQDIQNLSFELSTKRNNVSVADAPLVPDSMDPSFSMAADAISLVRHYETTTTNVGMRGEDWKLLLIAASKEGDWKLCINTLQFLRPFIEATNPRNQNERNKAYLDGKYRKLSRSLTATMLCFEVMQQHGWPVRVMDDWIQWSGRRPPKEAILSVIRTLVSQGRGREVLGLIQQVLLIPPTGSDKRDETKLSYEEIIYVGGITHLHNHGLYEDADALYLIATRTGQLSFKAASQVSGQYTLDLHGMNTAVAHSAVRMAFTQDILSSSEEPSSSSSSDLIIITGRGLNSYHHMRPVIRPEIQRMLTEEFYPPLTTASVPGNLGALKVPAEDIQAWVSHQKQQKGIRMLAVAEVLKSLSGGRLRESIMKSSIRGGDVDKQSTEKRDSNAKDSL